MDCMVKNKARQRVEPQILRKHAAVKFVWWTLGYPLIRLKVSNLSLLGSISHKAWWRGWIAWSRIKPSRDLNPSILRNMLR